MKKEYKLIFLCSVLLLFSQAAWAQFTVTGTVTDAGTGEPLISANIFNKASGKGATTNPQGQFSITLPGQSATLRITYIGYVTQNIEVSASNNNLNIVLKQNVANLDELVVTGLATSVKRENLANDVTKVNADELNGTVASPTIDNALSGKIPGVSIKSTSGAPGGGFNVQMRGVSTLGAGSSQPLYIIDGVYVNNESVGTGRSSVSGAGGSSQDDSGNRLADLNPEDIQSIEVLKGPSAAAIYGQRANAGVVIITTKRGKSGETQVSFEQNVGFSSPLNLLGVPSWNEDKIRSIFPASTADAEVQKYEQAKANGNIYDYEKMIYDHQTPLAETNISVSGGNENTRFFISGGYHTEDGIVDNTGFNRGSVRANLDQDITDHVHLSSSSNFVKTDNKRGFTGNQNGTGGSIGYSLAYIPTYAQLLPDDEGNYPNNPYFDENPLALIKYGENNENVTRVIQSLKLDADLYSEGGSVLSLNLNAGVDYLHFNSEVYLPEFLQDQAATANPGDVIRTKNDNLNTNLQGVLLFKQNLNKFNLTSQVGFSRFGKTQSGQQLRGQGLVPGQDNIKQAQVQSVFSQTEQKVVEIGFFGQQEVNWDDKLIGTVGLRMDRSSLNFKQDHYYFFPKASLAMNLANFDFFNSDKVDQFKLRVAYGETGGVPNYGATFRALNGSNIGNNLGLTISSRDIDPNLQPERAQELEFGTDIGIWDNRVSLTATYYNKTVKDLILDLPTASSTGVTAIATNAAELVNKGVELGLNIVPVQSPSFSWESDISFWKNNAKITKLIIPPDVSGGFGVSLGNYLLQEGYSPTTIVGIPAISDGKPLYKIYGNAQPDYQMSFNEQISFLKSFQFSFLLNYSKGGYNVNLFQFLTDGGGTSADWNDDPDGDGSTKAQDRLNALPPESYVQEASYLKLRQVGLYYTVPTTFMNHAFGSSLKKIRVGVSGSNLWMWTTYPGYDPETSAFGTQAINQSVSVAPYPSSKKFLFNIQVDL